MKERIIKALSAAVGAAAGLLGGWSPVMTVLAAVMAADYISGVLVALAGRSPKAEGGGLSSRAGFAGLARKGFILLIVLVAALLDRVVGDEGGVFRTATAFYYIANEALSLLENAHLMGVSVPKALKNRLEVMRDEREEEPGKDGQNGER